MRKSHPRILVLRNALEHIADAKGDVGGYMAWFIDHEVAVQKRKNMHPKNSKLTAKPIFLLYEKGKGTTRIAGWRYSWNNGETTDVFIDTLHDTVSIRAVLI